ncbi:hypothetical protein NEPAR06_1624 [Nematocida parisii]|uniref:Uncharacterized protein n=1 Tax=Nematocida parisii (strain ERTm3) TaxID=935791 RepID=I3EGL1_NEMP3|nr:uncharacterized protein NEPG_01148 [Nematocida parisii ERTm1]EIJ88358.1 hypothetical protein NEQG_01802 [Nematocida parisii ERTm3]KAI5127695.1 hypothetical protein NEPAR08_1002 [Nematocida parisii]EIJ93576.1 hypothetical protein NEPG_01148 [Nematocida parisii ERTm1]KAI5129541.1 hypothetical protein NEPAR03_1704 [Nematocida parisii]KAI5141263.1 hypothetical protein NEPAR04_0833 [Nematocida parisii]|eukprot:XP_013058976.1 hypothetical protein NEPG_01148 [Nematocida parisii ERTm1]
MLENIAALQESMQGLLIYQTAKNNIEKTILELCRICSEEVAISSEKTFSVFGIDIMHILSIIYNPRGCIVNIFNLAVCAAMLACLYTLLISIFTVPQMLISITLDFDEKDPDSNPEKSIWDALYMLFSYACELFIIGFLVLTSCYITAEVYYRQGQTLKSILLALLFNISVVSLMRTIHTRVMPIYIMHNMHAPYKRYNCPWFFMAYLSTAYLGIELIYLAFFKKDPLSLLEFLIEFKIILVLSYIIFILDLKEKLKKSQ